MKLRTASVVVLLFLLVIGGASAQDATVITTDNVNQLEMLIRLGRGSAEHVAWTPDGSTILVGGSLGVWKYDAAALDTDAEPELINPGGEVYDFAVSPDGSVLTLAHSRGDGYIHYDLATGELLIETELDDGRPQRMSYSSDGQYLAFNNGSRGLNVVDVLDDSIYNAVDIGLDVDVAPVFTPDASHVMAVSSSNTILVWDMAEGGDPVTLSGHSSSIEDIAVSADGSLVASGSTDDSFIIWDLAAGEMLSTIAQPDDDYANRDVYAVAFSPDASVLLTGHGAKIRFWDVVAGEMISDVEVVGPVEDIVFSPDGSQFAVISTTASDAVQLYNADGTAVATSQGHNRNMEALTFSLDSAVLAFSDSDGFLYMWDTAAAPEITGAIRVEDGATFGLENLSNITYSSDGQYIAIAQGFSAELRNPVTGALIRKMDDLDGSTQDIEFSPDNTMLAVITSQGLYIFDVESGSRLNFFADANDWMNDVGWSPDQTMVATASSDYAVRVYALGD